MQSESPQEATETSGDESQESKVCFTVLVAEGAGGDVPIRDVIVEIVAFVDHKLYEVRRVITKQLGMQDTSLLSFSYGIGQNHLDVSLTLQQLDICDGHIIHLDRRKSKKRRISKIQDTSTELCIICTTRLGTQSMDPPRRIKVFVSSQDTCRDMMGEVCDIWERNNLKFKCGRITLKEDKTYEEQGVVNGSEIIATVGR